MKFLYLSLYLLFMASVFVGCAPSGVNPGDIREHQIPGEDRMNLPPKMVFASTTINESSLRALLSEGTTTNDDSSKGSTIPDARLYMPDQFQISFFLMDELTFFYEEQNGTAHIVDFDPVDGTVRLVIDNLRGIVISQSQFWEKLEIVILLETSEQNVELFLLMDGQTATGYRAPRDYSAYKDMEPEFSKQLGEHAGNLLTHLKFELVRAIQSGEFD